MNVGNQRVFFVLTSVAIIMFYIAYLCVTGPLLIARLRGKWPTAEHGPYFSLGRWGLPVNVLAVVFQIGVMVNLAWPRAAVYGGDHWYFQWGAFIFIGVLGARRRHLLLAKLRGRPASVLAEHRAGSRRASVGAARRAGLSPARWQDIAEFLGSRPPFDAVGADDLARVAAVTETEVSPAGRDDLRAGRRAGRVPADGPGRLGRGPPRRAGPGPARPGRAVRAGLDDLRAADRLRGPGRRGHGVLPHPRGRRAPAAGPADVLRFVARSIVAGRDGRAVPRRSGRPGPAPRRGADPHAAAAVPRPASRSARRRSG